MLKDALESLGKNTLFFGISGALSKCLTIITLPILTRVLSKQEYGSIDAAISLTVVFVSLAILGQDASLARFFYDRDADEEHRCRVASSILGIQCGLLLILGVTFLTFGDSIGNYLFSGNFEGLKYWKLALWTIPGTVFYLFSINILKWTVQRTKFLIMTIGSTATHVGLTLLLVLYYKLGVRGAILAAVLSINFFGMLGLALNLKYLRPRFFFGNATLIKQLLIYGIPFTVILVPSIDRFFLIQFASLEDIGVYAVGMRISSILTLATSAFSIAFGPFAFSIWHKKDGEETLAKICKIYFLVVIIIAGAISGFSDLIIRVLASEKYLPSVVVIPPLLLAAAFQGLFEFGNLGILKAKKSYYNVLIYAVGMGVLVIGNFLLVPRFSILGSALSLLATRMVITLMATAISKRYYRLPIEYNRFIFILLLSCLHSSVVYMAHLNYSLPLQVGKLVATMLLPIVGFMLTFDKREREEFYSSFRRMRVARRFV